MSERPWSPKILIELSDSDDNDDSSTDKEDNNDNDNIRDDHDTEEELDMHPVRSLQEKSKSTTTTQETSNNYWSDEEDSKILVELSSDDDDDIVIRYENRKVPPQQQQQQQQVTTPVAAGSSSSSSAQQNKPLSSSMSSSSSAQNKPSSWLDSHHQNNNRSEIDSLPILKRTQPKKLFATSSSPSTSSSSSSDDEEDEPSEFLITIPAASSTKPSLSNFPTIPKKPSSQPSQPQPPPVIKPSLKAPIARDEIKRKRLEKMKLQHGSTTESPPPLSHPSASHTSSSSSSGKTVFMNTNFVTSSNHLLSSALREVHQQEHVQRIDTARFTKVRNRKFYDMLLNMDIERDTETNLRVARLSEREQQELSKGLVPVPDSFQSVEQYANVFTPHIVQECVAQIQSTINETMGGGSGGSADVESMLTMQIVLRDVEMTNDSSLLYFRIVNSSSNNSTIPGMTDMTATATNKSDPSNSSSGGGGAGFSLMPPSIALIERRGLKHEHSLLCEVMDNDFAVSKRLAVKMRDLVTLRMTNLKRTKALISDGLTITSQWTLSKISLSTMLRQAHTTHSIGRLDAYTRSIILDPHRSLLARQQRYPYTHEDLMREEVMQCHHRFKLMLRSAYNQSQITGIINATRPIDNRFVLVQGPPGTGKTKLALGILATLVQQRMERRDVVGKRKIVVCAPSNQAVDEILRRVVEQKLMVVNPQQQYETQTLYEPHMVRFGIKESVHPSVAEYYIDTMVQTAMNDQQRVSKFYAGGAADAMVMAADQFSGGGGAGGMMNTESSIKQAIMKQVEIIFVTLSSSGFDFSKSGLDLGEVSHIIIDECCQCVEPELLIPIAYLSSSQTKYILIGDPCQLPATILGNSRDYNYSRSFMERLMNQGYPAILLNVQHRMHPAICEFPSNYFYAGRLVSNPTLFHGQEMRQLDPELFAPIRVYDLQYTQEDRRSGSSSIRNVMEAQFVSYLFKSMLIRKMQQLRMEEDKKNVSSIQSKFVLETMEKSIGIITPYKQQVYEIKRCIQMIRQQHQHSNHSRQQQQQHHLDINTVDGFQGREKNIVLLSCVRSEGLGFLRDYRRMNVAITRAKYCLAIVLNSRQMMGSSLWGQLIEHAKERGYYVRVEEPPEDMEKVSREFAQEVQKYFGGGVYRVPSSLAQQQQQHGSERRWHQASSSSGSSSYGVRPSSSSLSSSSSSVGSQNTQRGMREVVVERNVEQKRRLEPSQQPVAAVERREESSASGQQQTNRLVVTVSGGGNRSVQQHDHHERRPTIVQQQHPAGSERRLPTTNTTIGSSSSSNQGFKPPSRRRVAITGSEDHQNTAPKRRHDEGTVGAHPKKRKE